MTIETNKGSTIKAEPIKALRGMKDLLPEDMIYWHYLEAQIQWVTSHYAFQEIRTPLLESTQLFSRCIGEVTDIVEKEMYSFDDRNGESMTLKPEGTAGVVRCVNEQGMLANGQVQKLWYMGPMFRYERPQKGRYRQFHQFGVELFGVASADADAEILLMLAALWRRLGIADVVKLQINSLGDSQARNRYKSALVEYLLCHQKALDADSQRRLDTNPLRILDSKNPDTQKILEKAPKLPEFLDEASLEHFETLKNHLDLAGIQYEVNPMLVRGLDYYSKTVFEWVTDHLGAQGTVCGGGRYDGLVEQLGGKPTPAVGFGLGCERLLLLLQTLELFPNEARHQPEVYVALMGEKAEAQGLGLVENLRKLLPNCPIQVHLGSGSFKSQLKKADKSGASWLVIIGENELNTERYVLKALRQDKPQQQLSVSELAAVLSESSIS